MSTLTGALTGPSIPARLPLELIEHSISFIEDLPTLKSCCLVARSFVRQAQSNIFFRLDLSEEFPEDSCSAMERLRSITKSPHLTQHIRSIITHYDHIGFLPLLDSFPDSEDISTRERRLCELSFVPIWSGGSPRRLTTALLRSLQLTTFPFLTSLTLDSLNAPLALVTSFTALRCLQVYNSVLLLERDDAFLSLFKFADGEDPHKPPELLPSSPELITMPYLTILALDGTRNIEWTLCPIVTLIQGGRFPALKCLELAREDRYWFPLEDISQIVKPLMNHLVALDIGYWSFWDELDMTDHSNDLDLFQLHHFPHLRFFSTRLEHARDPLLNAERRGLHPRLEWLIETFERLTFPHPLEMLIVKLGKEWYENDNLERFDENHIIGDEYERLRGIWDSFDCALEEGPHLKRLIKLVMPVRPGFIAMRRFLTECLKRLSSRSKLSFEAVDMKSYV
ncbi:hypothetical protein DL96DRAFT_1623093 [Flagelloscypha sp. PMI_526]|nr:hypothetical protein DL96DRAFT_1623093 [Flagelloscypha sp. PMI_526]